MHLNEVGHQRGEDANHDQILGVRVRFGRRLALVCRGVTVERLRLVYESLPQKVNEYHREHASWQPHR